MRLKPMYFGKSDCAIAQLNLSHSFQLSPATFPESSPQDWKNTNAAPDSYDFNIRDLPDDLKVHQHRLCQSYT